MKGVPPGLGFGFKIGVGVRGSPCRLPPSPTLDIEYNVGPADALREFLSKFDAKYSGSIDACPNTLDPNIECLLSLTQISNRRLEIFQAAESKYFGPHKQVFIRA
jgi:hypothetical protein